MVFSSIPSYLDPSNWQQQQQQQHLQQNHQSGLFHHGINNISSNPSSLTNPNPLLPPPPLPPPQQPNPNPPPHTSASGPLIRPGSMAERARMANIPMPEIALKCPRCESTNTKFCYFNNYSLSQPRHFCKTCRRYWTRGGALRTVPVGGGCRRNKRSKSSSSTSKSSAANAATSSASSAGGGGPHAEMMGLMMTSPPPPPPPSLRFMTPMHHHLSELGDQLGLSSYGDVGFHLVGPTQFPFLGGLDGSEPSNLYGGNHHSFDQAVEFSNLAIGGSGGLLRSSKGELGVKVERGHQEMSLITRFNNNQHNGEDLQYNNMNWGGGNIGSNSNAGNGWTDLSALNNNSSCSTTTAL